MKILIRDPKTLELINGSTITADRISNIEFAAHFLPSRGIKINAEHSKITLYYSDLSNKDYGVMIEISGYDEPDKELIYIVGEKNASDPANYPNSIIITPVDGSFKIPLTKLMTEDAEKDKQMYAALEDLPSKASEEALFWSLHKNDSDYVTLCEALGISFERNFLKTATAASRSARVELKEESDVPIASAAPEALAAAGLRVEINNEENSGATELSEAGFSLYVEMIARQLNENDGQFELTNAPEVTPQPTQESQYSFDLMGDVG